MAQGPRVSAKQPEKPDAQLPAHAKQREVQGEHTSSVKAITSKNDDDNADNAVSNSTSPTIPTTEDTIAQRIHMIRGLAALGPISQHDIDSARADGHGQKHDVLLAFNAAYYATKGANLAVARWTDDNPSERKVT